MFEPSKNWADQISKIVNVLAKQLEDVRQTEAQLFEQENA
jgi:hypothetical protein